MLILSLEVLACHLFYILPISTNLVPFQFLVTSPAITKTMFLSQKSLLLHGIHYCLLLLPDFLIRELLTVESAIGTNQR